MSKNCSKRAARRNTAATVLTDRGLANRFAGTCPVRFESTVQAPPFAGGQNNVRQFFMRCGYPPVPCSRVRWAQQSPRELGSRKVARWKGDCDGSVDETLFQKSTSAPRGLSTGDAALLCHPGQGCMHGWAAEIAGTWLAKPS